MKSLFLLTILSFVVCTVSAEDFLKAKIYYSDGTVKSGLAAIPKSSGVKTVKYKQSESSKAEDLNSAELKKIVYYQDADSMTIERIATYKLINKAKTNDPIWMTKLITGYVSLYVYYNTGFNRFTGTSWKSMPGDYQYACIRKDEQYASIVSMVLDGGISLNNNSTFKRFAAEYFKDYAELSAKIEKKEYTFKNIEDVVNLYNKWKAGK